jgi:hypothetical protein
MSEQQQPKLAVIILANACSDPWTVVIELSNAFTAIVAMFRSILGSTVANLAEV